MGVTKDHKGRHVAAAPPNVSQAYYDAAKAGAQAKVMKQAQLKNDTQAMKDMASQHPNCKQCHAKCQTERCKNWCQTKWCQKSGTAKEQVKLQDDEAREKAALRNGKDKKATVVNNNIIKA